MGWAWQIFKLQNTDIDRPLHQLRSSVLLPPPDDVIVHFLVLEELRHGVDRLHNHAAYHPHLDLQGEVLQMFCKIKEINLICDWTIVPVSSPLEGAA